MNNTQQLPVYQDPMNVPSSFTGTCRIVQTEVERARNKEIDSTCHYVKGKLHKIDAPARIYDDGSEVWYEKGKLHRVTGPAYINSFVRAGKTHNVRSYYIEGTQQNAESFWRHYLVQLAKLDHILRVLA